MKSTVEPIFVRNKLDNRPARVLKQGKVITLQLLGLYTTQIRVRCDNFERDWKEVS